VRVSLFNFGYVPFGFLTPTFTFWHPIGVTDHSTLADVITQEAGHMFGLAHDGLDNGVEYYSGHGTGATSWGPVMGAPFARNVTPWSRNEYPAGSPRLNGNAFPIQDDIAIIAGKLGFRADDFADTIAGAADRRRQSGRGGRHPGAYAVSGTFVRVVKIIDFHEPLTSSVLTPGRTVPVKLTLTDAVAAARVLLLPGPLASPDDALAEALCKAQSGGRQHCNLKLPSSLQSGATYWIASQFQDIDGSWATARPVSGGPTENPRPVVVE
jgi:hypothetical protein